MLIYMMIGWLSAYGAAHGVAHGGAYVGVFAFSIRLTQTSLVLLERLHQPYPNKEQTLDIISLTPCAQGCSPAPATPHKIHGAHFQSPRIITCIQLQSYTEPRVFLAGCIMRLASLHLTANGHYGAIRSEGIKPGCSSKIVHGA